MKHKIHFFKQYEKGSCDIVAVEDVLSYLHLHHSFSEIKERLDRHEFGTWLPDIGSYFEDIGIKTRLFTNTTNFHSPNAEFEKIFAKYRTKGICEYREPTEQDIKDKPVIVNVDAFKIRNIPNKHAGHYVVILREKGQLFMYDGNDYDKKIPIDFKTLYSYSLNICDSFPRGMWLFIE